jgi:hypothetical protein
MATALQFFKLWKRDRKLRAIEEGSCETLRQHAIQLKSFSRSKLTLSPGERKPAAPDGENSASCEVGGRSGGF